MAIPASTSDRVRVKRSSSSPCASSPSESRRLMIDSTSRRRPLPRKYATVAWPASCVATAARSTSVYTTGCLMPISSVSFASYTSSSFIGLRPSRSATSSASSNRCSIITGV